MSDYKFYSKQKSIEDLIIEVADSKVNLDALLERAVNEDAASQNPKLMSDIAELKRKFAASNRALEAAMKLKNKSQRQQHRTNILKQQASLAQRIDALKSKTKDIDDGGMVGAGARPKKKSSTKEQ